MKNGFVIILLPLAVLAGVIIVCQPREKLSAATTTTAPLEVPAVSAPSTPAVLDSAEASAYEALEFRDMFVAPVGPKGLEFTARLKALEGRKVRMTGQMVRYLHADPEVFLFTELPMTHNQQEYILADSLPVDLMHVVLKVRPGDAPVWTPVKLTLYGTLELGGRQELDGRISFVRLRCDHVTDARSGARINLMRPIALQKQRIVQAGSSNGGSPANFRTTRTNQDSQLK